MSGRTYELMEVFTDPRTGKPYTLAYDTYLSLATAKKEAKALRGRWVIVESKIVAKSDEDEPLP